MLSTFVSVVKLIYTDHIARQKHESALESSCIKVSKQYNFHWVQ